MMNKNIFFKEELEKLPLTYRIMDILETEEIKELYKKNKFYVSKPHMSNNYPVYDSIKPISNYIYDGDE